MTRPGTRLLQCTVSDFDEFCPKIIKPFCLLNHQKSDSGIHFYHFIKIGHSAMQKSSAWAGHLLKPPNKQEKDKNKTVQLTMKIWN